jgi:hypothetical protein
MHSMMLEFCENETWLQQIEIISCDCAVIENYSWNSDEICTPRSEKVFLIQGKYDNPCHEY